MSKSTEIVANTDAIAELGDDLIAAKRALLGRLAERGYQLLRAEVPYETGNLKQGVAPPSLSGGTTTAPNGLGQTTVDLAEMQALLTVSARSGATLGGSAEVFDAKGRRVKTVSLRPRAPFNYAEAVARGRASISPRTAKALLIPLPAAPNGEGYLLIGGQVYIVRRSAGPVAPNPFDERAATKLESEAPAIGEAVLREFV